MINKIRNADRNELLHLKSILNVLEASILSKAERDACDMALACVCAVLPGKSKIRHRYVLETTSSQTRAAERDRIRRTTVFLAEAELISALYKLNLYIPQNVFRRCDTRVRKRYNVNVF